MELVHGGRLVAQALKKHQIKHLFTLCGGHIQAIYDGCLDEGIRVIDVRHEQTAGHAADGYARITGNVGVCAVTAGPGVTNVVTAVANAQRAGVPIVVLGGAGPSQLSDKGSLQDMNHVELMRPITKWSVRISETERIGEYMDAAFRVAQAGVPGPVFLELPLDVLMGFGQPLRTQTLIPILHSRPSGNSSTAQNAADMLFVAQRPVVLIGSQIRWSPQREVVQQAADAWQCPFFLNGMARGSLPAHHAALCSRSRRFALSQADVVLVFGTPFDFRLDYGRTLSPHSKVIQIDLDGRELGRNRDVDIAIEGDSGLVLEQLLHEYSTAKDSSWLHQVRTKELSMREAMQAEMMSDESPINPLRLCAEIQKYLGSNDCIIGDGGDFIATAANVLQIQWPQIWMDPGPLGTLGVGPGYAMAASLLRSASDSISWLLYGDGSFGFHAMEFEAMARQNIPVLAVIGNDAAWTQIRRGQIDLYGESRAIATKLAYTRYEQIVEACGGIGFRCETVEQVHCALDEAIQSVRNGKSACINVMIAQSNFRKGAISV